MVKVFTLQKRANAENQDLPWRASCKTFTSSPLNPGFLSPGLYTLCSSLRINVLPFDKKQNFTLIKKILNKVKIVPVHEELNI